MNLLKQQKQPPEVFHKKMFLEISQYLQESIYVGISLKAFRPAILFKTDTNRNSCEYCKIFKNT